MQKPRGYSSRGASLKLKNGRGAQVLENASGPEATFLKAQEALRSRRFKEAADYFAELAGSTSEFSTESRLGLADTQMATGELEAALKTLGPLLAKEGSADPRARLIAAEINLHESNISEAERLISGLKANSGKTGVEKICLQGQLALKKGKLEDAAAAFNKVLEKPEDRTFRMVGGGTPGAGQSSPPKTGIRRGGKRAGKIDFRPTEKPSSRGFISESIRDLFQGKQPRDFGARTLGRRKARKHPGRIVRHTRSTISCDCKSSRG